MRDFQRRMFVEASIEAVFRVPILPEQYEPARRSHKRISYKQRSSGQLSIFETIAEAI